MNDESGVTAARLAKLCLDLRVAARCLCSESSADLDYYRYGGGRDKRRQAELMREAARTIAQLYVEATS